MDEAQTVEAARERLRELESLARAPLDGETEDVLFFGRGEWVYCRSHMAAHQTGWCSVSPREKIGLGVETGEEADAKCRAWGFDLT